MYNPLNRGQSNAGAFECIRMMQALKHAKQFIYILHIKAYAVVPNEHHHLISVSIGGSDLDFALVELLFRKRLEPVEAKP